jgi:hypothetical protein
MKSDWKCPKEELPEPGDRVEVMVVKQLIYQGNATSEGSDWLDDHQGPRAIFLWRELDV